MIGDPGKDLAFEQELLRLERADDAAAVALTVSGEVDLLTGPLLLDGLNAAAGKGNHGGRPPVITDDMLHTVLRRRAGGKSMEDIRPDLIIPTGKRKGHNPSTASIYRALGLSRQARAPPRRHPPGPRRPRRPAGRHVNAETAAPRTQGARTSARTSASGDVTQLRALLESLIGRGEQDAHDPPVFRLEPKTVADSATQVFHTCCGLTGAARAADCLDRNHPSRSFLRAAAHQLGIPLELQLIETARIRREQERQVRERQRTTRPASPGPAMSRLARITADQRSHPPISARFSASTTPTP